MSETTALLIIDAQYDFCHPNGALYVPGAEQDVQRIAALIGEQGEQITEIFVSLDQHRVMDIAHPLFWEDPNGTTVAPFTRITAQAVREGRWIPRRQPEAVLQYLDTLEQQGSFQHFIWPEHCLIGTPGAALDATIAEAIVSWSHRTGRDYTAVVKGLNPLSEHFGIFRAQVPVAGDEGTSLNQPLLDRLSSFDRLLVCGEARSHCVATSIQQIIDYAPELVKKLVILTDCMSDVTHFEHLAQPIFDRAVGALQTTTKSIR
ncbi:nicotinamidase-related amidase [Dyadobacter jejuensis]|uniref:Nicotinamidase-related amidase n=1 Tax=Dyadobacter jejuensis TaxID=1082580 RepID=A0A316AE65_9BACT|nr:isochorismatase family protein [Dyadobacter jejuensis]PWJ55260.1 nicotinamidase-related amidase [Dyadobacter jejuensis]